MLPQPAKTPGRWCSRTIPGPANPDPLRAALPSLDRPAFLESVSPAAGRFSIYAWNPVRQFSIPTTHHSPDPLTAFANQLRQPSIPDLPENLPFLGGWIGYLAYELGRSLEPKSAITPRSHPLPLAHWNLYDTILLHDRASNEWTVAGIEIDKNSRPPLAARLDHLEQQITALADSECPPPDTLSSPPIITWSDSKPAYLQNVRRILDYLAAGDVFQVNLARRCTIPTTEHPADIYRRLCRANPSSYAAYLHLPSDSSAPDSIDHPAAILSSSPELFLQLDGPAARRITTRPIKGTRPRTGNHADDEQARRALLTSQKDRAELNMIIDLMRNDLGRVSEPGSVLVESDGDLEPHPTVFHRTAQITGRLRPDRDLIDLLRATFPGGSITGAPKVRAMQIIEELEPHPRGPYCGAIGYISPNGRAQLNLAIRTLALHSSRADLWVGSGIVADSDPEEEFAELAAKAAGMFAALIPSPNPDLPQRASHIPRLPLTSRRDVQGPTSDFPLPTSPFPLPPSDIPLPTSHIPLPRSDFPLPTSDFPRVPPTHANPMTPRTPHP